MSFETLDFITSPANLATPRNAHIVLHVRSNRFALPWHHCATIVQTRCLELRHRRGQGHRSDEAVVRIIVRRRCTLSLVVLGELGALLVRERIGRVGSVERGRQRRCRVILRGGRTA